jgi:hypothetical protein
VKRASRRRGRGGVGECVVRPDRRTLYEERFLYKRNILAHTEPPDFIFLLRLGGSDSFPFSHNTEALYFVSRLGPWRDFSFSLCYSYFILFMKSKNRGSNLFIYLSYYPCRMTKVP